MKILAVDDFRGLVGGRTKGKILDRDGSEIAIVRDAQAAIDPGFDLGASKTRRIPYLLSNNSVARDGHTVKSDGFELGNYRANPVFLWAHDTGQPPVGRVVEITMSSTTLRGVVEYADADLSPFADMIFRMVKKRYLNAVSISWLPMEWKFSTDRNRPGGVDFLRQDLLEVSQVPVPAMASALATARAEGIDTGPMVRWAEQIIDSGASGRPRSAVEQARLAALGQTTASDRDRAVGRRRRAAEALEIRIRGEDIAARQRAVEALQLAHP
jgi:hypothetical protein